jgi:hypothetical protein
MNYLLRLIKILNKYWKRLLVGATAAWALVVIFNISLILLLEWNHILYKDYDLALFQLYLFLIAAPAGCLIAYAKRN